MTKDEEQILVVRAEVIFSKGIWQGLKKDQLDYYIDLIKNNYQFKRRGDVESDSAWQQIIPYIIFSHQNNFFIYRYLPKAGEQRLVDTYQMGVGGHINKIDTNGSLNVLEAGMMREWDEEIYYNGRITEKKFIGLLNDDSRPVEAVHLGLVYHFVGDSPAIAIKEKEKMEGQLLSLKEIKEKIGTSKESIWARIVWQDYLSTMPQL